MGKFCRQWIWPVLVAGLIFYASSRPYVAAPGEIPSADKIAHFGVFGLLATLICRLRPDWRGAGWALLVASIYGVTDEVHQMFVPGRSPSVGDWVADTSGAALAVTLYVGVGWYRRLLEMRLWSREADATAATSPATAAALARSEGE